MQGSITFYVRQAYPHVQIEERLAPWAGHRIAYCKKPRYYRDDDFQMTRQPVDGHWIYLQCTELRCLRQVSIPLACKRHDLYWLFQLSGDSTIRDAVGGETLATLEGGSHLLAYSPPAPYRLVSEGDSETLVLVLRKKWLKRYRKGSLKPLAEKIGCLLRRETGYRVGKSYPMSGRMLGILESMLQLPPAEGTSLDRLLTDHVDELLLEHLAIRQGEEEQGGIPRSLIHQVRDYISTVAVTHHVITADELADKFNLSYSQMKRFHHKWYGLSPISFALEVRLSEAERLLSEGHSVSSVAEKLGFSGIHAFSKWFKKHRNVPPSRFSKT